MVPVAAPPPVPDVGFMPNELSATAVTVSEAVWVVPPYVAVIVTVVEVDTAVVVAVNVALVLPAATATDGGTVTAAEFELSDTTA